MRGIEHRLGIGFFDFPNDLSKGFGALEGEAGEL